MKYPNGATSSVKQRIRYPTNKGFVAEPVVSNTTGSVTVNHHNFVLNLGGGSVEAGVTVYSQPNITINCYNTKPIITLGGNTVSLNFTQLEELLA